MFSLDSLIPDFVPYPIKGGILRGIRTGLAAALAGVSASVLDGSLFNLVHVIPSEYAPAFTMVGTTVIVGVEKWLRERGILGDAKEAGLVPPDAKEIPQFDPVEFPDSPELTDDTPDTV